VLTESMARRFFWQQPCTRSIHYSQ